MKYKVKDYIGQKFGYLTLVSDEPHPDKLNRTTYLCRCDCGGTRYVRLHMLVEGAALTCSRMCKFHGNNHTRAKPVIAKDEQGNVIARYDTITEVARLHGKETATANYWIKHRMTVKGIRYFFDEEKKKKQTEAKEALRKKKKATYTLDYQVVQKIICITPCPFLSALDVNDRPKIGSSKCMKCRYFVDKDSENHTVSCSYKARSLKKT